MLQNYLIPYRGVLYCNSNMGKVKKQSEGPLIKPLWSSCFWIIQKGALGLRHFLLVRLFQCW